MWPRGMRALLAVLVLTLLPVPAAEAFHDDGVLVVTGSRTASTTLTLPEGSRLVFDPFFDEVPVVTGGRDLAGIVVTDEAGNVVLYDVRARVAHDAGLPRGAVPQPGPERARMSDGERGWYRYFDRKRYTVTLLADAPVTVRIGVQGMRGRTLRPTTPVPVTTHTAMALPTLAQPRGEARVPLSLRRSSTVLVYGDYATTGYQQSVQWLCVGDPGERCDDTADAWTKITYDYGILCGGLCGASVRSTSGKGASWVLRPRRQGAAEAVARSSMPYGVTTDQRAYVLVVG